MFFSANTNKRNLKRILLVTIVLAIGGVIAVFGAFRWLGSVTQLGTPPIQGEAEMSLQKVHQTAITNGIKEWTLDSETVDLMGTKQRMLLTRPSVEFFMQDGSTMQIAAEKGVLATDSKDITVSGNVRIRHKDYRLNTERLEYRHKMRHLFTDATVVINGPRLDLSADSLFVDLEAQVIVFKGNVEGKLREALTF
jgi:LPS export ABC transporter protein LptC